ncbi:MAG TPA: J domain-containing protein [Gammaproteobacteria bacterium]
MAVSPMTFRDCYRMLRVSSASDWDAIRLAYRRRIHGCHPDLAPVVAGLDRTGREEEFKRVVKAYRLLAEYRKRTGGLPSPNLPVDPGALSLRAARRRNPAQEPAPTKNARRGGGIAPHLPRFHQAAVVAFLTGVGAAALVGQIDESVSRAQTEISAGNIEVGMNPRDVVDVQGIPSYTKGSVWFYGESGVIFDRGCVVGWQNQPPFPLRTLLTAAYLPDSARAAIDGSCRILAN